MKRETRPTCWSEEGIAFGDGLLTSGLVRRRAEELNGFRHARLGFWRARGCNCAVERCARLECAQEQEARARPDGSICRIWGRRLMVRTSHLDIAQKVMLIGGMLPVMSATVVGGTCDVLSSP